MSSESTLIAGTSLFLAAWTDERALIASAFLLLCGRKKAIAVAAAWTGYIVTRLILTQTFSLTVATGNVGLAVLGSHLAMIPVGIWTGLGGLSILVALSLIALPRQRRYRFAAAVCRVLGGDNMAALPDRE